MADDNEIDEQVEPEGSPRQDAAEQSFTNQAELVQGLIDGACEIDKKTGKTVRIEGSKITTADLIRLMQFQRELTKEQPVDVVEMRWIDTPRS